MDDANLPRVLRDRYRLDAVLGKGGMGVVYRGFDLAIERPVAVKLLRRDLCDGPDDAKRLLREVRATANVKSPHSVTLFDVGETDEGDPFLVMNFIEGEPLVKVMGREKALSVARAVAIGVQVCEALGAAHTAGILHRDVKPANIMLTPSEAGDFVTVVDFGIAKRIGHATSQTAEGALVGTVQYMAPEQIAGGELDGRVDQYALAAMLLRIISGQPLFPEDAGVPAIIHNQLLTVPVSLLQRLPGAPPALSSVLSRALEKKPDARYSDMVAFAAALRASVDPVRADDPRAATSAVAKAPESAHPTIPDADELVLDHGLLDTKLELDAIIAAPRPLPAFLPPPRPRPLPTPPPRHEAILAWLPPELLKRVCGYSGFALLMGKLFFPRYLVGAPTAVLTVGFWLGGAALGLVTWLTRDDP